MQRILASLDKKANPLPLFVTLTYPDRFPEDPKKWCAHLAALRRRYERKWGRNGVIFRKELMDRKSGENVGKIAVHFHMLIFVPPLDLHAFRCWLSLVWSEVVGSGDPRHLAAGTNCKRAESWRQVGAYLSKYIAKLDDGAPSLPGIGRHYGVWWPETLVSRSVRVPLVGRDSERIHRWYRRLSGLKVQGPTVTVFVNESTTLRLLRWLGYYADLPPAEGLAARGAFSPPAMGPPAVGGPVVRPLPTWRGKGVKTCRRR
jgi:hypothetical protein